MSDRLRVLYILGEGRSGSTILDILLSSHDSIVGVGELWSFFEDDESLTGMCTCGLPYRQCPFWKAVRQKYLDRFGKEALPEINHLRKRHDAVRWTIPKLLGYEGPQFGRYCEATYGIYDILAEVSGRSVIVDSTKQIGRALNLLRCSDIDTYLLHLVRDGRGVIWSRLRDKRRNPSLKRKGPLLTTIAWIIKNKLALQIGARTPDRTLLIRYEDLVSRPEKELHRLQHFCGLDMQKVIDDLIAGKISHTGHQIGGNVRARSGSATLRLSLDEEWKQKLPHRNRLLFQLLASGLVKYFGYE